MLRTWCSFKGSCVKYFVYSLSSFIRKHIYVFLFPCFLICSYSLAFEESGLTLEQEVGGYGTIEEITG